VSQANRTVVDRGQIRERETCNMDNWKLSMKALLVLLVVASVWKDADAQNVTTTPASSNVTTLPTSSVSSVALASTTKAAGTTVHITGSTILMTGCVAIFLNHLR